MLSSKDLLRINELRLLPQTEYDDPAIAAALERRRVLFNALDANRNKKLELSEVFAFPLFYGFHTNILTCFICKQANQIKRQRDRQKSRIKSND